MPRFLAHHRLISGHERQPRRFHIHHEAGNTAVCTFSWIGHGHQLAEAGFTGAGDEALGAIDNIVVALAYGPGFHRSRIAARVRLGLHEATLFLTVSDWI